MIRNLSKLHNNQNARVNQRFLKVGFDVIKNKINPDQFFDRYNRYIKNTDFKDNDYEFQPANKNGTEVLTLKEKAKQLSLLIMNQ